MQTLLNVTKELGTRPFWRLVCVHRTGRLLISIEVIIGPAGFRVPEFGNSPEPARHSPARPGPVRAGEAKPTRLPTPGTGGQAQTPAQANKPKAPYGRLLP